MAEQAYAYVTLIPVAKGFQSAVAKELGGAKGVGKTAGEQTGKTFSKGFAGPLKGLAVAVGGALAAVAVGGVLHGNVGPGQIAFGGKGPRVPAKPAVFFGYKTGSQQGGGVGPLKVSGLQRISFGGLHLIGRIATFSGARAAGTPWRPDG